MLATLSAVIGLFGLSSPTSGIDIVQAKRYFQEAQWISDDDAGALWGTRLYGPMIFVEPRTRAFAANQPAPDGGLREESGIHIGTLPGNVLLANTAFDWGRSRWTMVLWPLPQNRADRATLLMHELFHRIQPEIGLSAGSPQNAHLETEGGRIWLQVELRALAEALSAPSVDERRRHGKNALAFREVRYRKFPKAKAEEDQLELNEGLAEFTGFFLRGGSEGESRAALATQVRAFVGEETYARSFAYKTGAAYAFLLNNLEAKDRGSSWRRTAARLKSLADAVASRIGYAPGAPNAEIARRALPYGLAQIKRNEAQRERDRQRRIAEITRRFVDGPTLGLPFAKMNISFDPQTVFPLGANGTYYPTATIQDEWGKIEVTGGILIASDWSGARVAAPTEGPLKGPGWSLQLNPGWSIDPAPRKGSYVLSPKIEAKEWRLGVPEAGRGPEETRATKQSRPGRCDRADASSAYFKNENASIFCFTDCRNLPASKPSMMR